MLFIVVCTFTICWAPDQICYLLMNLEVKSFDYEYSVVYPYFVLLAMANSCLNPIIYSFKSKPFKDALRKMLGRKNRVQDNGGSLNSIAQNCSATGLGTSPPVGNTNAKTTDSSETVSPALWLPVLSKELLENDRGIALGSEGVATHFARKRERDRGGDYFQKIDYSLV